MELLNFQTDIVHRAHGAMFHYKPLANRFPDDIPAAGILRGEPRPFVCQMKAVTGAGKTPILAYLTSLLRGSIILWTTPRSAVISQTLESLKGKYRSLLAPGTEVFDLGSMSDAEWEDTIERGTGVTILVASVASYNQDGDKLKLHRGNPSRWNQLKWFKAGGERRRKLYICYDEGHNATERQFGKLLELRPDGFLLASASALSEDLYTLLPGETPEMKLQIFNSERLLVVNTREVVEANLLKRELEMFDLDEPWQQILAKACAKREYLSTICSQQPLMCCIVKRTENGIDVWKDLVALGVPPEKIAVHLANASEFMRKGNGGAVPDGFQDTYSRKATPEDLRQEGFSHIIWNLTLQEGWDEPWAFVAYIHDPERSVQEIEQKIGRFIRNPFKDSEGVPITPEHPDLRKAYFYFNASNRLFSALLESLKESMNMEGYEVLRFKSSADDRPAQEVDLLTETSIPRLAIQVTDPFGMTNEFLAGITEDALKHRKAGGKARVGQLDLLDFTTRSEVTETENNVSLTVAQAVRALMEHYDWRFVKSRQSTGSWFAPTLWCAPVMESHVECGSPAYDFLSAYCKQFAARAGDHIRITVEDGADFHFSPVKLSNPDGGDSDGSKDQYKVRNFAHSIHPAYNGFKPYELEVAQEIDQTGLRWAKNSVRTGYGIPLPRPSHRHAVVFPTFVVWSGSGVLFVDATEDIDTARSRLVHLPPGMDYLAVINAPDNSDTPLANAPQYTVAHVGESGALHSHSYPSLREALGSFCF